MAGLGRQIGGLVLCIVGVFGLILTCALPMWRETSFVGSNVVTAQSIWDGLWLQCVVQATGQMQCKRQTSPSLTTDLQAARALSIISIISGFLGFMVALLGGGVAKCRGEDPDPDQNWRRSPSRKKACILGGALCALSGVLCLVSVSWSAAFTTSINNDQLVAASLKRDVGSSVYVGLVSSLLLLVSALLIGLVCWKKNTQPPPSDYSHFTYSDNAGTIRSDRTGPFPNRTSRYAYPVYSPESVYSQGQWGREPISQYPAPFWAPVFQ